MKHTALKTQITGESLHYNLKNNHYREVWAWVGNKYFVKLDKEYFLNDIVNSDIINVKIHNPSSAKPFVVITDQNSNV